MTDKDHGQRAEAVVTILKRRSSGRATVGDEQANSIGENRPCE